MASVNSLIGDGVRNISNAPAEAPTRDVVPASDGSENIVAIFALIAVGLLAAMEGLGFRAVVSAGFLK